MVIVHLRTKIVEIEKGTEAKFVPPTEIGGILLLRVTSNRYDAIAEFQASEVLGWAEQPKEE